MPPIEELQVTNVVQNCNSPIKRVIYLPLAVFARCSAVFARWCCCICQVLSYICQVLGPQSLSKGAVRVVPCLGLLTALEDILGSLGPTVNQVTTDLPALAASASAASVALAQAFQQFT